MQTQVSMESPANNATWRDHSGSSLKTQFKLPSHKTAAQKMLFGLYAKVLNLGKVLNLFSYYCFEI
jgi:hypothetical protein